MRHVVQQTAALGFSAAVLLSSLVAPAVQARHATYSRTIRRHAPVTRSTPRHVATAATQKASPSAISPLWPAYDEIKLVIDRGIVDPSRKFDPASPLTAGALSDAIVNVQKAWIHQGASGFPPMPPIVQRSAQLTREEAVDMLVKAMISPGQTPTWTEDTLSQAVVDYGDVQPDYKNSVALAAQHFLIPNPLRPTDQANWAFGAAILARALPWDKYVPKSGPFVDEIHKALSMHLLYTTSMFPASSPVTAAELGRAIERTRMFTPHDLWLDLPDLPLSSTDKKPLTRAEAIDMITTGLIADRHFEPRLAAAGDPVTDPDAVVPYSMGPKTYLASLDDASRISSDVRGPIAVAVYKGWLPNLPTEPGKLCPEEQASLGYVATILARAVDRPGDYTGVVIDMSQLKPIDRAGGMWILNAGDSPVDAIQPVQVYPFPGHIPVRPFFAAPGSLGFYGHISDAERGRAGPHPLIIKALDWAQYDWSTVHGAPGLRRGGGVPIPLDDFHFNHGTPALILLSPQDAQKLSNLDHISLLLRKARIALVQPNWDLTAMK